MRIQLFGISELLHQMVKYTKLITITLTSSSQLVIVSSHFKVHNSANGLRNAFATIFVY